MEVGSLFTGGGGLDMGLEAAGLKGIFQVENDKHCITLLNRHWPDVPKNQVGPVSGLVGGDPCPVRSSIGKISGSSKPDMSGYFLAMVQRCQPGWVLRENVVAPDVVEFVAGLEVLGYHCAVVETNSAAFTGQARKREFVVGFREKVARERFAGLVKQQSDEWVGSTGSKPTKAIGCITSRGRQAPGFDKTYVFEEKQGRLRSLTHAERESLQGWPIGWTSGLPHSARERITGNGVTATVAQWIGKRMIEAKV